jgi:hypothetical protein
MVFLVQRSMKYEIKALNIRDKKVNCELHGMAGQM